MLNIDNLFAWCLTGYACMFCGEAQPYNNDYECLWKCPYYRLFNAQWECKIF